MTTATDKKCCEWHNALPEVIEAGSKPDKIAGSECGLAGTGRPMLCCAGCPQVDWFLGKKAHHPADIDFAKEIAEQQ